VAGYRRCGRAAWSLVEPLKEWRFGRRAITLIKAYNRYVVGFSRDDDGEISGTGLLSRALWSRSLLLD
jgi:hypothetical protein